MNTSIGFVALCLILCSGLVQSQNNLNQYCKACLANSATSGLYSHPNRCDAFVQCDVMSNGFRAQVRMCPPGLYFDQRITTCNWPGNVKCEKDCKANNKIKDAFSCNGYFECINKQRSSYLKKCPLQQRFDAKTLSCVPDATCPLPTTVIVCSDAFRLSTDPSKFSQWDSHRWIVRSCAPGTGFNMTTCSCSNSIQVITPEHICELVNLPLIKDTKETTHNWFIVNEKVDFQNNAAQFNGNAFLVVPVMTNNDLGDKVEISVDFMLKSSTAQDKVAIISNSDCKLDPTYAIYAENSQLVGLMEIVDPTTGTPSSVKISTNLNTGQWNSVKLSKNGAYITLKLNNQLIGTRKVPGNIKVQDCALTIGKAFHMTKLTGSIKNVVVSKCPK